MRAKTATVILGLLPFAVHPQTALAQEGPALSENPLTMERLAEGLRDGSVTLDRVRRRGLEVFTTSFNTFDGFGEGAHRGGGGGASR